jgi:4-hydroxybenzoate polyprenyltransferase
MATSAAAKPLAPPVLAPPVRPVSWLRAARVGHWAHFLALPAAGWDPRLEPALAAVSLGRGVAIAFAVLAFGYLLNGIADRHMDAGAEKNPLTAEGPLGALRRALALLALAAVALSLPAPRVVLGATAACLASGVVYSVGPRLKRYPLLGTLLNATNFAPLLWVGMAQGGFAPGMIPLTAAFSCLLLQNQLLHEAADREEDLRGRLRTSVLALGPRGAALAAAAFGAGLTATAAALPSLSRAALPLALVYVVAFPLLLARAAFDARAMSRARLAHRFFAMATGALFFAALRLG